MKQRLLFGLFILLSISIYSQQGPPPPCGIFETLEICDENQDGILVLNLRELFPFNQFCLSSLDTVNEEDYYPIFYYLTENDMNSEVNAIQNPESYTNTAGKTSFYLRANRKVLTGGTHDVLTATDRSIEVIPAPGINQPLIYEVCDDTSMDSVEVFDLYSKNAEIIGSQTGLSISYHSTQSDAENKINQLPFSFTNFSNPQTIYVNVMDDLTGCFVITTFDLVVKDCSNSGVIKVNAFYDEDTSGTFENNETLFVNGIFTYEANNDGIQHIVSSSSGSFSIISDNDNNTYNISYSLYDEYLGCYTITTPLYEDVSATNGNMVTYNFPITKNKNCGDIAVYLVSYVPPRPGFDYINRLVIKNKGLETVTSGTVEFIYDASITFNNVTNVDSGNMVTNTSTGFTLDFFNLAPNEQETVTIKMNVPVSTSLGTLLTNTATYSVTDLSTENNTSVLSEVVIGSYDPNDIAESHGPEILYSDFETTDYLYYTVRFQNVGTADAINVSIDNTLDSRLDKSTIQMLSSSHTNVFTRVDNQLNWKFDDIHLPSEDMDEPNSHGYVYYKIKPATGYSVGDIIPNTAEIYFDFNPAVVTNTFHTEFITTLSNEKFSDSGFVLFPNPANNLVELKFNKNFGKSVETIIYDIHGKMIFSGKNQLQSRAVQLNVSALKSGLYFLRVNDGVNELTRKLIVE